MTLRECRRGLFRRFVRHSTDTHIWKNGVLVEQSFMREWDRAKCRRMEDGLRQKLKEGCAVHAVWKRRQLIGFCAVEPMPYGSDGQYLNLLFLHVSKPYRGQGLGAKLFALACNEARARGAQKLYLGAAPNKDTVAFYRRMGCTEAVEHIQELIDAEPDDYPMEIAL